MPNLIKKFQNISFQYDLFKKGDGIVLAVSGGPDSCAMLDIFSKLQKKYSFDLILAHVNYKLRGKDSSRDEKFVRRLAKKYRLEIFVLDAVETHCNALLRKNISENSLRKIRYDFFEKIRKEKKINAIAVAHNRDDQAETFLIRAIRGAGTAGLGAMRFKNGYIIRPLLAVSRAEILNYLKENKLKWRLDKTNLESKFLRNKVRNKLIPMLEKIFNPDIKKTLANSAVSIAEDEDFLSEISEKIFRNKQELQISKILKLHPAIQKRILRKFIEAKKKALKNIEASHIEELLKAIKSTKNKPQVVIFKGLKISRKGDKLKISKF